MDMSLLNEVREANKGFSAGTTRLLPAAGDPFLVVACADPRLTGLLEPAMGLPRQRAILIRIAGNRITPSGHEVLSSVAASIFIKGGKEIFVVGHTDCALSTFSTTQVVEAFRKEGIPRSAFGDGDLREWFGAFGDVRANVLQGIENLRRCGFVPSNIKIHGLVIDTRTGAIDVVHDGDLSSDPAVPPSQVREAPGILTSGSHLTQNAIVPEKVHLSGTVPSQAPPRRPGAIVIPPHSAPTAAPEPPSSLLECAKILADFFAGEQHDETMRRKLSELRAMLTKEKNPLVLVSTVQRISREYGQKYPRLPGALQFLLNEGESQGLKGTRLSDWFRQLLG